VKAEHLHRHFGLGVRDDVMAAQMQTQPATAAQWTRALARAIDEGLDVLVEPTSGEAFIESVTTPGTLYAVSTRSCSCKAGQRGIPCKHRAAYLAQIGELHLDPDSTPTALGIVPARPCFWCNGSGRIPNDDEQRHDTCSACSGTGTALVPESAERIAA
jgi:hypothetical protein